MNRAEIARRLRDLESEIGCLREDVEHEANWDAAKEQISKREQRELETEANAWLDFATPRSWEEASKDPRNHGLIDDDEEDGTLLEKLGDTISRARARAESICIPKTERLTMEKAMKNVENIETLNDLSAAL